MIYAGVEVSRKEGKKKLSVICVEVMVYGTRGNEVTERSDVHDEEYWTKDRALGDTTGGNVPGGQQSLFTLHIYTITFVMS